VHAEPDPTGGAAPVRTLTVLGCDGSWPGPGGAGSGYLVTAADTSILLDAGPGTFAALQRHIDPARIEAVVLTHAHPDHWTDLESFATWAGYGPGRSTFGEGSGRSNAASGGPSETRRPLTVYAPPGLRERSSYATAAWLDWNEIGLPSQLAIGALEVRFGATDHGTPTLAVWLSHGGATFAYSADSGPRWSVAEFGSGIDVFLCEATYTQQDEGVLLHLSGRQAGAMARSAGVDRLILTHRWPTVSANDVRREAALAFGRPVEQASRNAVFRW
jgi:ribonuclease BN (tRNA processing enzyme)